MRIYIESTIPSYVVARPARDLLQAARQQLAKDWWELERQKHELFTSQVVLDEIAFGEKEMAARRLQTMRGVPLLRATGEVKELAGKIFASGLLPSTADRDATHIALASVYEMDILLTWSSRHIANAAIRQRLRQVEEAAGFVLPVICMPEELMETAVNKATDIPFAKAKGDVVLREVWRAKDTLSAQYGHDLDKLFAETRNREKLSGHPLVDPPKRRRKA